MSKEGEPIFSNNVITLFKNCKFQLYIHLINHVIVLMLNLQVTVIVFDIIKLHSVALRRVSVNIVCLFTDI